MVEYNIWCNYLYLPAWLDYAVQSWIIGCGVTLVEFVGGWSCVLPIFIFFWLSCGAHGCRVVYSGFSPLSTFEFGRTTCVWVGNCGVTAGLGADVGGWLVWPTACGFYQCDLIFNLYAICVYQLMNRWVEQLITQSYHHPFIHSFKYYWYVFVHLS